MSLLSALIQKRDTRKVATAIPAISATQPREGTGTVARIATVAVANPKEGQTTPPAKVGDGDTATIRQPSESMTADEEARIRAWLEFIGETDPVLFNETMQRCATDPEALHYFLWRAAETSQTNEVKK